MKSKINIVNHAINFDYGIINALEINAPSLLISYIRPLVALVTGSSKYPAWNIPFLDMRKTKEVK